LKDLRAHADENVSIIREPCPGQLSLRVVVANKTDLCSASPTDVSAETSVSDEEESSPSAQKAGTTVPSGTTKLQPRAVTAKEGLTFAKENGLLYVETSAKEGWGVVDAFERTAKEALKRHNEDELARRRVSWMSGQRVDRAVC